jgi:hypothetical protein
LLHAGQFRFSAGLELYFGPQTLTTGRRLPAPKLDASHTMDTGAKSPRTLDRIELSNYFC